MRDAHVGATETFGATSGSERTALAESVAGVGEGTDGLGSPAAREVASGTSLPSTEGEGWGDSMSQSSSDNEVSSEGTASEGGGGGGPIAALHESMIERALEEGGHGSGSGKPRL
jgi:hypothetical protein